MAVLFIHTQTHKSTQQWGSHWTLSCCYWVEAEHPQKSRRQTWNIWTPVDLESCFWGVRQNCDVHIADTLIQSTENGVIIFIKPEPLKWLMYWLLQQTIWEQVVPCNDYNKSCVSGTKRAARFNDGARWRCCTIWKPVCSILVPIKAIRRQVFSFFWFFNGIHGGIFQWWMWMQKLM